MNDERNIVISNMRATIWVSANYMTTLLKGLITVGRELRQQHPSDLLYAPAGQQITRVLLP